MDDADAAFLRNGDASGKVWFDMTDLGAEIVPDSKLTPESLQVWLKSEIDKWGPIIKATGSFAD